MALVIVPADQFVILGIEVGQRNFVISSLVPQIDLDVVGGLIAGITFHDPAGAQLIHHAQNITVQLVNHPLPAFSKAKVLNVRVAKFSM